MASEYRISKSTIPYRTFDEEMEWLETLDFLGVDVIRYGWVFLMEDFEDMDEELAIKISKTYTINKWIDEGIV